MNASIKARGLSLVELLIVVTLVAVLGAISYPSYQNHLQATKRYQAQTNLYQLQIWLEQQYTANANYPNTVNCTECQLSKFYDFAIKLDNQKSGYQITATPKLGSGQEHDPCFMQTLTHLSVPGSQDEMGNNIEMKTCWR